MMNGAGSSWRLTRISHQLSAAAVDRPAPAASNSLGRPRRSANYTFGRLGRLSCIRGPLRRFASIPGEKPALRMALFAVGLALGLGAVPAWSLLPRRASVALATEAASHWAAISTRPGPEAAPVGPRNGGRTSRPSVDGSAEVPGGYGTLARREVRFARWGHGSPQPAAGHVSLAWPQLLNIADFILGLQDANGAILDQPGATTVNQDSNMEYALIGLAAAYAADGDERYLAGFEAGIRWLAGQEEMSDPAWRGSWYYAYASVPPYAPLPVPAPGAQAVRGVDATSALFAYLLYLDSRLTGSGALAAQYAVNGRAALDFVRTRDLDADGLTWNAWQQNPATGAWHLYDFQYTADQGDVYLGMQAGRLLYGDSPYGPIADRLRSQIPALLFSPSLNRYGRGRDEQGLHTALHGFTGLFPQGYLPWVLSDSPENRDALSWLQRRVRGNGSIRTTPESKAYSLSVALLGMAERSLGQPEPDRSYRWLIAHAYDPGTGGVHDTLNRRTAEYDNVAGFCIIGLSGFLPFS